MKIVSAETLTGYSRSLDRIDHNLLENGDYGIVNGTDTTYMYHYDITNTDTPNSPDIIEPISGGGRWLLLNVIASVVNCNTLSTDTIHSSGGNLLIDSDVIINAITTFNPSPSGDVSFSVPNNNLITNLNVNYIDGHSIDEFLVLRSSGITYPPPGEKVMTVLLPEVQDNLNYVINFTMVNDIDINPSIYSLDVIDKTLESFVVQFSGDIDSGNHFVMWNLYSN